MGRWRLLDDPHDQIADDLDELEDRLDNVEHQAEGGLVPNHDHAELQRSVDALRADQQRLEHELTHVATLPIEALEPIHARLGALEGRIDGIEAQAVEHAEHAPEDVESEAEDVIELPAEIVEPKRVHPMRSTSWPRIL